MSDHWLKTERGWERYKPRRLSPDWWAYLVGALVGVTVGIPLGLWISGWVPR